MRKAIKIIIILSMIYAIAILFLISNASASTSYIARGDPIWVNESHPQGTCWYFPDSGRGTLYDLPVSVNGNESYCVLQGSNTTQLQPIAYTLVYEEPTFANGKYFKDISWVNNTLVSAFSGIHSIDESGKQAPQVMKDLQHLIAANGFNNFSTDKIVIQEPDLKLSELRQTQTDIYTAGGTSNLADGTPITIKIDEERYYAQHNDTFTYHSKVIRPSDQDMGTWKANMIMPIQEMPPGWHNISIYARELETTSMFKIDQHEWAPAPTPTEYVKYLSNGNIAPVTITIIQTQIIVQYQDRWHEATPTPDITDALGQKIPYPYSYGDKIPEWVALLALLFIAGIVITRDWKWKK